MARTRPPASGRGDAGQAQAAAELEHARAAQGEHADVARQRDATRPQLGPVGHELVAREGALVEQRLGVARARNDEVAARDGDDLLHHRLVTGATRGSLTEAGVANVPRVEPTELVARPAGRPRLHRGVRVGLGDVAPSGRVRLDALARWLQDAAHADVVDSGLHDDGVVGRPPPAAARRALPALREDGASTPGQRWRRAVGRAPDAPCAASTARLVEAVALWVHLAPDGSRPAPVPRVSRRSTGPRRGPARARAPAPPAAPRPATAPPRPWRFSATDLDLADHVNNAAYWAVAEEELAGTDPPEPFDAEIEHRAPATPARPRSSRPARCAGSPPPAARSWPRCACQSRREEPA